MEWWSQRTVKSKDNMLSRDSTAKAVKVRQVQKTRNQLIISDFTLIVSMTLG